MRRRLDLAAALMHRPPVLFLDEPTTGLDPQSRADVWDLIGELVDDGATVLLTTQYLEEADRLADRIVVVDDGRVIAEGTAPELKSRFGSTVIEIGFPNPTGALRASALLRGLAVGELETGSRPRRSRCASRASTTCSSPSPAVAPSPMSLLRSRRGGRHEHGDPDHRARGEGSGARCARDQRHDHHRAAQPDHPAPGAPVADLLDGPTGDLRVAVPLRVRRRHPRAG
jgi:hypothetical protein